MAGEVNLLALAERLKASVTGSCVCDECVLKAEVDAALREAHAESDELKFIVNSWVAANCPDGWIGELRAEVERLRRLHDGHREVLGAAREEAERLKALLRNALGHIDTDRMGGKQMYDRIDAEL